MAFQPPWAIGYNEADCVETYLAIDYKVMLKGTVSIKPIRTSFEIAERYLWINRTNTNTTSNQTGIRTMSTGYLPANHDLHGEALSPPPSAPSTMTKANRPINRPLQHHRSLKAQIQPPGRPVPLRREWACLAGNEDHSPYCSQLGEVSSIMDGWLDLTPFVQESSG